MALLDVEPAETAHADLMAEMAATEYAYVNTGDCSAYSSVVLQCGVSYSEDAIARHDSLQAEHDRPAHQHRCGGR